MEYDDIKFNKLYYDYANGLLENGRLLFIVFSRDDGLVNFRGILYFNDKTLSIEPTFNTSTDTTARNFIKTFDGSLASDYHYRFLIKILFGEKIDYEVQRSTK